MKTGYSNLRPLNIEVLTWPEQCGEKYTSKSKNIIHLHDLDNKEDILNSLELLDEEFNKKENSRDFLINALFLYLGNVELLSSEINILQIIWTKLNRRNF